MGNNVIVLCVSVCVEKVIRVIQLHYSLENCWTFFVRECINRFPVDNVKVESTNLYKINVLINIIQDLCKLLNANEY